jgi:hypothetical protein
MIDAPMPAARLSATTRVSRSSLRFAALAIAGVTGTLVGCVPSDQSVKWHIDEPADGSTVNGEVGWNTTWTRPWGFHYFAFGWDNDHPERSKTHGTTPNGLLVTTDLTNGPHRFFAEMHAWGFRVWKSSVRVIVDNPTHRLSWCDLPKTLDASTATLKCQYNEPWLSLRITSLSDKTCPFGEVTVPASDTALIEARVNFPAMQHPPRCYIRIVATNRDGKPLTNYSFWNPEFAVERRGQAP